MNERKITINRTGRICLAVLLSFTLLVGAAFGASSFVYAEPGDENSSATAETAVSTEEPYTEPSTAVPTEAPTEAPTTAEPTTKEPTTAESTTKEPTTKAPTTAEPTTKAPTEAPTVAPTTKEPTTAEPTTKEPTTEEETTEEPSTEPVRRRIWIKNDVNYSYADFANKGDYTVGYRQYFCYAGTAVQILIHEPAAPSILTVTELVFYYDSDEEDRISVTGLGSCTFVMPDHDIMVQVIVVEDEAKIEASIADESRAIEESIAIRESIEESIAAEKRFRYGSYLVETDISKVVPPVNFIRANDVSNFDRTVGCFYSTDYRVFVYYASADEVEYSYYVLDPIAKDLLPFVTFPGSGSKSYIVTSPSAIKSIPGVYRHQVDVELKFASSDPITVRGFETVDDSGETLVLLYLSDENGDRQFFVYKTSGDSVELTEYTRYEEQKKGSAVPSTERTLPPSSEPSTSAPGRLPIPRATIWLVIIGVVLFLLIVAFVIVFIMSKHQEAKEAELELEEAEDEDEDELLSVEAEEQAEAEAAAAAETETNESLAEDEEEVPEDYDTTLYKNGDPSDLSSRNEASEFNFENAFPTESPKAEEIPLSEDAILPEPPVSSEIPTSAEPVVPEFPVPPAAEMPAAEPTLEFEDIEPKKKE